MALIIILYALGLIALIGVFCGAEHQLMNSAICFVFATLFLMERRDAQEQSEEREEN